ncbi:helix-turn-helix transcriptional regulator [Jeotgalibaca porci]|uniref:helix-turn-helix transcriptional regulator n=1 Tax=Jeotgalibaca porci TaxID=1868793 RepID=UPI0035A1B529
MSSIKEIREDLQMTQQEMADRLSVSRLTYLNYESGRTKMDADKIKVLLELSGSKFEEVEWTK